MAILPPFGFVEDATVPIEDKEEERLYEWAIGGHLNNSNETKEKSTESLIWVGWSFPPSILVELPKKIKNKIKRGKKKNEQYSNRKFLQP